MTPFSGSESAVLEVMVTEDMTGPADETGPVRAVYGLPSMTRHFEEVGRRVLAPNLGPGEEATCQGVNVEQTAAALLGMWVRIEGRFERSEGRRLYCRIKAYNELGDRIGQGTCVLGVSPRERVDSGLRQLEARFKEHREGGFGVRQYTRSEREP